VIGVFGGSGFYDFLDAVEQHPVHTPYGPPSAPVAIGTLGDQRVAFMPRHGRDHEHPPHRLNYRANVWAMQSVGVTRLIGPCAAGSLHPLVHPGDFVVLDQLVDRTWGRPDTYFDGGVVGHVSFADPYCPELRSVLVSACRSADVAVHERGTVVVIQGPRFSTRAESNWYRAQGWEVINMTQYPEAFLARELGLCYAGLALITDYDTGLEGVDGIEPVSIEQVFSMLRRNVDRTGDLLFSAIPAVPSIRGCSCASALSSGPLGR
jgi:5'-methylthioadenosine phosphorylase